MMRIPLFILIFLGGVLMWQTGPMRVGPMADGTTLVPTGQTIRPAGEAVQVGGRPVDLALSPDGKTLYAKDDRGLVVVDTVAWKLRQELKFQAGGGSMHGLAVSRDGSRVYATTAQNLLAEAVVSSDGTLSWARKIALPGPNGEADSHGCGIALSPDGKRAYVCLSRNNSLGIVDLAAGRLERQIPVGIAPFDVALSPDGGTAYVSDWGGRHPHAGEPTAKSSGTDTVVDARGVAASGCVSIVDLTQGVETAQMETGLHPSDIELSADGNRLYIANANSDTISVLATDTRRIIETIPVRPNPALPFGSAPNALALSHDGKTLYVANGGNNALAVIALGDGKQRKSHIEGFIPVGWYPGSVVTDGTRLFVGDVKGLGSRRRQGQHKGWSVFWYQGTLDRIPIPSSSELRAYTAQVRSGGHIPQILQARQQAARSKSPVPVPERVGEPSVFSHLVYVIKENRTYDQIFGDMAQGNSDPSLVLYGRDVTPNHHALAEQFVLLDNFYCNGVLSADGHSWATEGNVTDHLEKSFGGFTRSYTFGDDPLTYSSSGFVWDAALAHGHSFRNYGEMDYAEPVPRGADFTTIWKDFQAQTGKITFTQNIGIANLRRYSSRDYPGWNLSIPDVLRADRFLKELRTCEQQGVWPDFQIVYLPNDHTSGTSPGAPTPRAQVADNDLALGRIVEGISHSQFWPKTCIFVIEDDPQDGFDHVDGHRSLCLVISPYTRRHAVVSHFYNQTSVLHTMLRILGASGMNQMDSMAPLMRECFVPTPNLQPYTCVPNRIPLDEMNPPLHALHGLQRLRAQQSLAQPFDKPDKADESTLNHILWYAARGGQTPYPTRLSGAHGTGLKALHLRLTPERKED
jgi:YVTN family beta-propeller protein